MAETFETLVYEKSGARIRITFNRPERLNATAMTGVREFDRPSEAIERDAEIRLVTISGTGRAFSTDIDLKELTAGNIENSYFEIWDHAFGDFFAIYLGLQEQATALDGFREAMNATATTENPDGAEPATKVAMRCLPTLFSYSPQIIRLYVPRGGGPCGDCRVATDGVGLWISPKRAAAWWTARSGPTGSPTRGCWLRWGRFPAKSSFRSCCAASPTSTRTSRLASGAI